MGPYDNQRWALLWTGKALTHHRDSMCHDCASVLVACPAECVHALGGRWAEAAGCLILPCPECSSLPQTSKSHRNQTQVAGCPPRQQSCSNFCFKWFVSLLFQLIVSVTASKNSQQSRCCDYWCQPPSLPSSAFLLLSFPFLSLLLLLGFVKKGWHFIDITCQAQSFLFVG